MFLVPALGLHAIDAGLHSQLLSALALFLAIPGLALVLIGPARTGRSLSRSRSSPLRSRFRWRSPSRCRWFSVRSSRPARRRSCRHFGVSVFREGTDLHTTGGTINIIDACSGFSTLYAAAAVAFLAAYSHEVLAPAHLGAGRRSADSHCGEPAARVRRSRSLVIWYGNWVLASFLHPLSGMLTFALALPLIFWLGGPASRGTRMIDVRHLPALAVLLALTAVPTVVHSYLPVYATDGRATARIASRLNGLDARPTDRSLVWLPDAMAVADFTERRYGPDLRLLVVRSLRCQAALPSS